MEFFGLKKPNYRTCVSHEDLILCDYKMPYLSGCDLAKKIATEINTAITIIIITAVNDIGINPLKLQVYFKPILMSKLIDIVKKNISSM